MKTRLALLAFCTLLGCTPQNVADAEKKKSVTWLEHNGSPEAVAALGRLADDDKSAQDALGELGKVTVGKSTTDGGAGALDVYLAVWGGVERNAAWALTMAKNALADRDRMSDMASVMKRGSPQIPSFVPDLEGALVQGCDVSCGTALASADGPIVTTAIEKRLVDARTREAMCEGVDSSESSKGAREVFMRVKESSRDAEACMGAAAHIAARDDVALAWLAKTAEPGLLRSVGDLIPCDRLVKFWSTLLTSRDHATYGALARSLENSIKTCPKQLDATLAGALGSDMDSQTLVLSALGAANASDLKLTCAAAPTARVTAVLARANARDFAARCAK